MVIILIWDECVIGRSLLVDAFFLIFLFFQKLKKPQLKIYVNYVMYHVGCQKIVSCEALCELTSPLCHSSQRGAQLLLWPLPLPSPKQWFLVVFRRRRLFMHRKITISVKHHKEIGLTCLRDRETHLSSLGQESKWRTTVSSSSLPLCSRHQERILSMFIVCQHFCPIQFIRAMNTKSSSGVLSLYL